jgi:16S rRNA (uracil1498-N3)-methyltransferase
VKVRLVAPVEPAAESPVRLAVAQAVLKAESMDAVVRDLTMLGVAAIQPVLTARTETRKGTLARSGRSDRWRRIAEASAKQCGRAVLPAIAEALDLPTWLTADTSDLQLVLVEPSGDSPRAGAVRALRAGATSPRQVSLLAGPEGGWTAEEVARIRTAGWVPWTLGPRTLRAETAPVVAVSVLQFIWGGFD